MFVCTYHYTSVVCISLAIQTTAVSEIEIVSDLMHLDTSHIIVVALIDRVPAVYISVCSPATSAVTTLQHVHLQ
jgi:hypothetical protein